MIVLRGGYAVVPSGWLDHDGYYNPKNDKPAKEDYTGPWALISMLKVDTVQGVRMSSHKNPDGLVAAFPDIPACEEVVTLLLKLHRHREERDKESEDSERWFHPTAPVIPKPAQEFAAELGKLTLKYGLRYAEVKIQGDTGHLGRRTEHIREEIKITVSNLDGRGRPRQQVTVTANIEVSLPIVHEPNSSD